MKDLLLSLIYEQLEQDGSADEPWSALVMEACEGEEALKRALDGVANSRTVPPSSSEIQDPPAAFLKSVTVQGFRGIGKKVTLELPPGPGLTVVIGRNGSGKSSFAEGLELLLTGENKRWEGRPKAWQEGWKNLHSTDGGSVEADFDVEDLGAALVQRRWGPDDDLHDATTAIQPHGKAKTTLDALGWCEAVSTYRPFLSYNELGSMLDDGPSKLYDALSIVLGLDELVEAEAVLSRARKSRESALKSAKQAAAELSGRMDQAANVQPDDRIARCQALLSKKTWDLNALNELLNGVSAAAQDGDVELLRRCASIVIPGTHEEAEEVSSLLDAAFEARATLAGTEAEHASELAELLSKALEYHASHDTNDCPMCGSSSVLGGDWKDRTSSEVERLSQLGAACEQAELALQSGLREGRRLLQAAPEWIRDTQRLGIDPEPLLSRWEEWTAGLGHDPVLSKNSIETFRRADSALEVRRTGPLGGLRAL